MGGSEVGSPRFIAELLVSSPLGSETVRGFDVAWARMLALPLPASSRLLRFVRIG
jgi:hypothetical protein